MTRSHSALVFVAAAALAVGAAALWREIAPAPVEAQTTQTSPVAAAFVLNAEEWVVVNERGESAVYSKQGTIIRRCIVRPAGPREVDCRNP
jgi:hypothetical protein